MLDLNKLCEDSKKVNDKRMENGATVSKDLLKHCSGELMEAMEARTMYNSVAVNNKEEKERLFELYSGELGDVITCVLIECAQYGVDIEKALLKTFEKNRKRAEGIGDKI